MFTEIATEDVLKVVRAHDFDDDPELDFGAARIDAVVALERLGRAVHAEQAGRSPDCIVNVRRRWASVAVIRHCR